MSIEYTDGSFSPPEELQTAMKRFQENLEHGVPMRALHIGSEEELKKRAKKGELEKRFEELKAKVEALEGQPKSDTLHIPTAEEIKHLMK